jgi:hypothetical protein
MEDWLSFSFSLAVLALPLALVGASLLFALVEFRKNKSALASTFIEGVFHVPSVSIAPQMLRIYAARVIAGVTDFLALWNPTFEFLVYDPVSEPGFVAFIFPRDLPVSFVIQWALVIPAAGHKVHVHFDDNPLPRKEGFNNS